MAALQLMKLGPSLTPVADTVLQHAFTDNAVSCQPLESFQSFLGGL